MERFAPKAQLTAIVDNWSDYYVARAKAVLDGTWKSEDTWGGLDAHMVVMSPYKNMPDDVKKLAEETEAAIKSGKLNPFKCPVIGQDGKEIECKGKRRPLRRAGARHELLREGHRRQDAAISFSAGLNKDRGSRATGCLFCWLDSEFVERTGASPSGLATVSSSGGPPEAGKGIYALSADHGFPSPPLRSGRE